MKRVNIVKIEGTNSANVIQSLSDRFEIVEITSPSEINDDKPLLILPGNGNFKHYVETLEKNKWREYLKGIVASEIDGRLISICSGFQVLGKCSDESPGVKGLNILEHKFEAISGALGSKLVINIGRKKIAVEEVQTTNNCKEIKNNLQAKGLDMPYFVHGYAARLDLRAESNAEYCYLKSYIGEHSIVAGILTKNIMATQFHPELSGYKWKEFMVEFLMS